MLSLAQRLGIAIGMLGALAGLTAGIAFAFRTPRYSSPIHAADNAGHASSKPLRAPEYFPDLPPPALVLMLSGQTYGYLQPCGCSRPQLGGLERRFELLARLQARGWVVSVADLGDIAPKQNDEQARLKYETAVQILHGMRTAAIGMGYNEAALPLKDALDKALNYQPPYFVAANLNDKDARFPEMFRGWSVDEPVTNNSPKADGSPRLTFRVGYVGLVGDSVAKKAKAKDAGLTFDPIDQVLPRALAEIKKEQPDLLVLLFQGWRDEAKALAAKFPQFSVILALDDVEEPSTFPEQVGETLIISTGHKGRYMGLVGLFPAKPDEPTAGKHPTLTVERLNQAKFTLHYQLANLGEFYELPDSQTNPAREKMKDYVLEVHRKNFLQSYRREPHPLQARFPEAKFVGSEACKDCHRNAYATWSPSRHSHAYESLIKYGRPIVTVEPKDKSQKPMLIGRQFDPDCVKCHTTGFGYHSGFIDEQSTPKLLGNGCENCHGPGSLHVAKPKEPQYSIPLRLSIAQVEKACRRCHDQDNDPNFDLAKYWEKIKHGK